MSAVLVTLFVCPCCGGDACLLEAPPNTEGGKREILHDATDCWRFSSRDLNYLKQFAVQYALEPPRSDRVKFLTGYCAD